MTPGVKSLLIVTIASFMLQDIAGGDMISRLALWPMNGPGNW